MLHQTANYVMITRLYLEAPRHNTESTLDYTLHIKTETAH